MNRLRMLVLVTVAVVCGGPAGAAVITRDVNVTLTAANVEQFDLDVNLDGLTDFTFTAAFVGDPFLTVGFATVDFPFGGNNGAVIDQPTINGFPTVSRLNLGDTVSPNDVFSFASFDQGNLSFFTSFDPESGNFGGRTGFVGLRFDTPNGLLFGFAEVTVAGRDSARPFDLTIGRVGFESVPGRAALIAVPEPLSVGLFAAAGVGAVVAGRRVRRSGLTGG